MMPGDRQHHFRYGSWKRPPRDGHIQSGAELSERISNFEIWIKCVVHRSNEKKDCVVGVTWCARTRPEAGQRVMWGGLKGVPRSRTMQSLLGCGEEAGGFEQGDDVIRFVLNCFERINWRGSRVKQWEQLEGDWPKTCWIWLAWSCPVLWRWGCAQVQDISDYF